MKSLLKVLVPLALLALMMLSTTMGLLLKLFVDFISLGYSQSGTVLLLLFLLLVFLTEPLNSPWRKEWNKFFLIGVLVLLLFGLVEKILFTRAVGLPLDGWAAACFDGDYATTRIYDMREPMAAVSFLSFVIDEFSQGAFFRPYLPGWLLALHFLVLAAVSVTGFLMVHHFTEKESTEKTVCLTFCVFALLKVTLDGGIFSPEVGVPIPFILGLLYGPRGARVGMAACLVYVSLTLWLAGSEQLSYNVLKALGGLLLLEAPLLWDRARTSEVRHWYLVAALYFAILLSLPWLQWRIAPYAQKPPFTLGTLLYGWTPLGPGRELLIFSPKVLTNFKGSPIQLTGSQLGQTQLGYTARVVSETTPMQICDMFGLILSRSPINWEEQPLFFDLRGKISKPPGPWPTSPFVVRYAVEPGPVSTRVVLQMRPGCRLPQAIDALPPGASVIKNFSSGMKAPEGVKWRRGPGAPLRQPAQAAKPSPGQPAKSQTPATR